MRTTLIKIIGIALIILGKIETGNSQSRLTNFEAGIQFGTFIYQGDLTPTRLGSFKTPGYQINIFLSKILSNSISWRANLAIGKLKGDDSKYAYPEYRRQRNLNFRSPVFEFSGLLVYDVLGKNYDETKNSGLRPYLFGGAGLSFLHIKRDWSKVNLEYFGAASDLPARIAIDAQHSLPGLIPVIPVGIGMRYAISQKISVTVESSYRFTFTDYLDGFSIAADPDKNDHYQNYSAGLTWSFDRKNRLNCPVIKK